MVLLFLGLQVKKLKRILPASKKARMSEKGSFLPCAVVILVTVVVLNIACCVIGFSIGRRAIFASSFLISLQTGKQTLVLTYCQES